MLWWKRLSNIKKVLYAGSIISLAAGASAGKEALIVGMFFFFVFGITAFILPNKKRAQTEEEQKWDYLIAPHIDGKDKLYRNFLSIIALIISLIAIYFTFSSLLFNNYGTAIICAVVSLCSLSSWLYLNPKIFNEFYIRTKMIPLKKKTTTRSLFEKVSTVVTPYGTPLLGFIENKKDEAAIYRIIDYDWIVYFYVRDDEVIIQSQKLNPDEMNFNEADRVFNFIQELADMFCYMDNTGKVPDRDIAVKIFKTK